MNQDFRIPLPFASKVEDPERKITYQIISEIGRGGSSIVYEVYKLGNPAKHYALKEYYPINEALTVKRDGSTLCFENTTELQKLFAKYCQREKRILADYLPHNNSEEGRYFIYKEDSFQANGTHYVVTDLENCQPLADSTAKDDLPSLLCVLTDVCKGLAILHHKGVYHLDISSRNILIPKEGCAKITDFGAAVTKEELENNALTYEDFVYTPAFSSMEVKRAAHKGMIRNINTSCDTFSVCGILFKYTVGRSFEPTVDLTDCSWEKDLHVRYHDTYSKSYINKLIKVIRRGLSGQDYRYHDAGKLAEELEKLTNKIERDKKLKTAVNIGGFTLAAAASVVLAVITIALAITPAPKLTLKENLDKTYYSGDDIIFELQLLDTTGSDGTHIDDATTALKLSGFSATRKVVPKEDNTYMVTLTDITFNEDGKKTIYLGDVYKSEWFGKQNKPFVYTFFGYVNEPRIVISQPTFTKVNSGAGHTVTYNVAFEIPAKQQASVNLSTEQIHLNGYTADTIIEQIGKNAYTVTFSNITGSAGACSFSINESACKLENGAFSRQATSAAFEIIKEEVSNHPIYMSLDVVSQDLREGGYLLLQHNTYSDQEYVSLFDKTMLHLEGFAADVSFEYNSYIMLDNLSFEDSEELLICADAGAYVSKENGSHSSAVQCKPAKAVTDSTQPVVNMIQLSTQSRSIKAGGDLVLLVVGSDETNCFLNKKTDIFRASGFSYDDCQLSVMGLTLRVVYTNVTSLGNSDGTGCIILEAGAFKDLSENESRQVEFHFTITP